VSFKVHIVALSQNADLSCYSEANPVTTVSTTATESGSAVAAGAANAGDLPSSEISGSMSTHVAMSAVVFSTLAGALALAF
jgi:hypothetical protein